MNFNDFKISTKTIKALEEMGFKTPTSIQELVIQKIIEKNDIVAKAPTGTGKTLAFGIPTIDLIDIKDQTQILVLCPTRELAVQIENEIRLVSKFHDGIKIVSIFGGENYRTQFKKLKNSPHIIIGTTGRIIDQLERQNIILENLKILILDEFDEMLNMGFKEDIDRILKMIGKRDIQKLFFSATLPKDIYSLSKKYQNNPLFLETKINDLSIPNINQYYTVTPENSKLKLLLSLIKKFDYHYLLIFCNTKKRVEQLYEALIKLNYNCTMIHGDLSQAKRDESLGLFKKKKAEILIATDIAARGLDINKIEAVINFDIPHEEEYYLHRIGRTARASAAGISYTFATNRTLNTIKNIENFTKTKMSKITIDFDDFLISDFSLFKKTLEFLKTNDLQIYRDFLTSELLKEENKNLNILDIGAALLAQNITPDFLLVKNTTKKNDSQKYFITLGKKDNFTTKSLLKFIINNTNIKEDKIFDFALGDTYSFFNASKDLKSVLFQLNGLIHNKRKIAIEISNKKRKH